MSGHADALDDETLAQLEAEVQESDLEELVDSVVKDAAESSEDEGEDPDTKIVSAKIFVNTMGPKGESKKVRVKRVCTVTDLRKALGTFINVPHKELELEINGEPLYYAKLCPFEKYDPDLITVHWFRAPRLPNLLARKRLKDVHARSRWGRTALHYAVMDRDVLLVEELLLHPGFEAHADGQGPLNAQDGFGDTALMLASLQGDLEIVEPLLERLAKTHFENLYGRTAVMLASEHGHQLVVQALLRAGADVRPPKVTKSKATTKACPRNLATLNRRDRVNDAVKGFLKEKAVFESIDGFAQLSSEA